VVRAALVDASGRDLDDFWATNVENGAFAIFDVTAAGWQLLEERVSAHLDGIRASLEGQAL